METAINQNAAPADDFDFDYLNQRAANAAEFEGPEFEGPEGAIRRIQHFNAHPLREGTTLEKGGFAIEKASPDAYAAFGELESIQLSNGIKPMYVSKSLRVAVVGWTPRYWLLHGSNPETGKYQSFIVPGWVDPAGITGPAKLDGSDGDKWKCDGRCMLFVVPFADPEKRTWALTLKGKENVDSIAPLIKAMQAELQATRRVLNINPAAPMLPHDIYVDITVSRPVMSGKPGQQSQVSPLALLPLGDDRAAHIARLAGPKNSAKFLAESQEVRALIDKGQFAPDPKAALGAPAERMQIGAPAPATQARAELPF